MEWAPDFSRAQVKLTAIDPSHEEVSAPNVEVVKLGFGRHQLGLIALEFGPTRHCG